MLGCAFELNIGNDTLTFNTVEELNDFIKNNKKRIEAALEGGQILFSKDPDQNNRQLETLAVLKPFIDAKADIEVETINEGVIKKLKHEAGTMGISKLIDTSELQKGKPLLAKIDLEAYRRNTISSLKEEIKLEQPGIEDSAVEAEAIRRFEQILKSWDNIRNNGNNVHYLADKFFSGNYVTYGSLRDAFLEEYPNTKFKDEVFKKLFNHFTELKARIAGLIGDTDLQVYTEIPLKYNNVDNLPDSNIVGIADLLVIDSKGKAHLFDYKTSYKHISDWDKDKVKRYGLQLSGYRQILRSHGIDVGTLGIIPFKMDSVDADKLQIDDISFDEIDDISGDLHQMPLSEFNFWMERRLPVKLNALYGGSNSNGESIVKHQELFFGLDKKGEYEKRVEKFLKYNTHKQNGEVYFEDDQKKKIKLSGNDRLDKQLISDYLQRKDADKKGRLTSIVQNIRSKTPRAGDSYDTLRTKGYHNPMYSRTSSIANNTNDVEVNARRAFSRYFHEDWEIMEFEPLMNEGILTFRNTANNVYEFVIVTDEFLDKPVNLTKSDLLLGHLYSKYDLKEDPKAAKATLLNINGIKILSFINENPEIFTKDKASIGMIRGINQFRGVFGADIDSLVKNFDELANKFKIPNQLAFVRKARTVDLLEMEVKRVLSHADTQSPISKKDSDSVEHIQKIMGEFTGAELLTKLINMYKEINSAWLSGDITKFDPKNELHVLASHVGILIKDMAQNPHKFTSENMVKNGVRMLNEQAESYFSPEDMREIGFTDSKWLSQKDEVLNPIARKLVINPIQVAMSRAQEEFVEWNSNFSRPLFKQYYKDTNVNIMAGDHVVKFRNLIEKDGKSYDKNFRFKNPEVGDSSYLTQTERAFLKKYLREINTWLYYDKTKSMSEMEKDAFFKGLGINYFNVPLSRRSGNSGTYTAVKGDDNAFKKFWGKTVKQFENLEAERQNLFEDQWQDFKTATNSMLDFYNKFDASKSQEARENLLIGRSLEEFEDNFEYLLGEVMYTAKRKEIFDYQLPIVNASLLGAIMYNNGYTTHEPEIAIKYGTDWIKTTIFNDNLVEKHQEKWVPLIGQSKKALSYVKLALTPLNFVREMIQGQFSNYIRIGVQAYGDDSPTMKDYTKALKIIAGESGDFLSNITLTEELNHFYGMADMDRDRLPEKIKLSKTGVSQMTGRFVLSTNTAPDYILRMSIMLAKMIKDGSYSAHSVDKSGKLSYDWTKDERFKHYAKGDTKHPDYKYQKALYNFVREQINSENSATGTGEYIKEGGALPKAYSNLERESVKSFINYIHGSYDHGDNILAKNTLLGMLFIQFRTWLFAKKRQYVAKRSNDYAIGSIKQEKDIEGNLKWWKIDGDSKIKTTENTGDPVLGWEGTMMEGVFNSMWRTLGIISKGDGNLKDRWKYIRDDSLLMANWKMALGDSLVYLLLGVMIKGAIDWGELEDESLPLHALAWTVVNAANDLSIVGNMKSLIDPDTVFPTVGYGFDLFETATKLVSGQQTLGNAIVGDVAVLRQIDEMTGLLRKE